MRRVERLLAAAVAVAVVVVVVVAMVVVVVVVEVDSATGNSVHPEDVSIICT